MWIGMCNPEVGKNHIVNNTYYQEILRYVCTHISVSADRDNMGTRI